MNNRNVFLIVLEAGKSKIKMLADSVCGKGFLVHRWASFVMSSCGGRSKASLWSLFYKGNNPIGERSTLMTYSLPKGSTSKYHHIGH